MKWFLLVGTLVMCINTSALAEWKYLERTDRLTDEISHMAWVLPEGETIGILGPKYSKILTVLCTAAAIPVVVVALPVIYSSTGAASVTYRFDKEIAKKQEWAISRSNGFAVTVDRAVNFIKGLQRANTLVLRYSAVSATETFQFDLAGFSTAAQPLLSACNIK